MKLLIEILGIILIGTGILDAAKYHWQSNSIRQAGIAKGHSRKFVNAALLNDFVKIIYAILIKDIYILLSSLLAFIFMVELMVVIFNFYPYKNRGLRNFKRPSFYTYFINSLISNKKRKRL
jgi:hypothetical protein